MEIIKFLPRIIKYIAIFCVTYIIVLTGCTFMVSFMYHFTIPDSHDVEAVYLAVIALITVVILMYVDFKLTIRKYFITEYDDTDTNFSDMCSDHPTA